MGKVDFQK